MKGTFKVYPERAGLMGGKVFAAEMWLELSDEERDAIDATGVTMIFAETDKDAKDEPKFIGMEDFRKSSGPAIIRMKTAFQAKEICDTFKSKCEILASGIAAYKRGEIITEGTFEL